MKKLKTLFSLALVLMLASVAAQIRITGFLVDTETNNPIVGGAIEVHENNLRTSTNALGQFSLELPPGNYHLHIEAPGYQAMDYDLRSQVDTSLIFKMQPTLIELKEILVEDSYFKTQQNKSSQSIEKINLEEVDRGVQSSLAEALKKAPGLNAYNTGVGIAKPVIRGFTGTRVAVYDQGVKQEGQQWGMDHGLEIDPFNAASTEIIKGSGALQYGSDAISGVMKILPERFPEEGLSGSYTGVYKTNNNSLGNSVNLAYRKRNQFVSARLSHQRYDDYRIPADEFVYNGYVLPVVDNRLKNTAGELLSARLSYGLSQTNYNLRIMLSNYQQKVGLYPGATGIPRAYDVGNIGPVDDIDVPNQEIKHTKLYASLNFKLGNHWLNNDFGFQQNIRNENSAPHAHGFQEIDENDTRALGLDLKTWSLNSKYNMELKDLKINFGVNQQFQQNRRSGWEYLLPDFDRYNGGLFAMVEGQAKQNWFWNAGARVDYAYMNSSQYLQPWFNDPDSLVERSPALERHFFNYAVAFGLAYNPATPWNIKLNMARSFRIPVAAELVSNGIHHGTFRHEIGTPDLDNEVGYQLDLGVSYSLENLFWRVTPFFNYFENFLFLRPSGSFSPLPDAGQIYRYTQAEAIHTGAEVYVEYHPVKAVHLSSALEYIYNVNLETSLPLPFTPPLSNFFSVEYEFSQKKLEGLRIGADYRWTAAQNRTDRNEPATPGFNLFHAHVTHTITLGSLDLGLGLRVQNIFNTAYLQHLSRYRILNLPEQGRNIILSVNLRF
jgi:iron complex outermembrane receptor protein